MNWRFIRDRPGDDRYHDPEPIREPAHQDAGQPEPDHRQRVRQRCIGARDAEFRLHRGERYDDRPHADAANRREREAHRQAHPGFGGFDFADRFPNVLDHLQEPRCLLANDGSLNNDVTETLAMPGSSGTA